jgi:hypothetical protein
MYEIALMILDEDFEADFELTRHEELQIFQRFKRLALAFDLRIRCTCT